MPGRMGVVRATPRPVRPADLLFLTKPVIFVKTINTLVFVWRAVRAGQMAVTGCRREEHFVSNDQCRGSTTSPRSRRFARLPERFLLGAVPVLGAVGLL